MTVSELVTEYNRWLADRTRITQIGDWSEVTTPFLDRHNDALQIYIKQEGSTYLMTDDGHILADLAASGCDITSAKRQGILKSTLNGFGIKLAGDELTVRATAQEFSQKKHFLVQAMLAVDDMFYMAGPVVVSLFLEDVEQWLADSGVRYAPQIKLGGQSGYDHVFDFLVPKFGEHPERIIKTINRPSREAAERISFAWHDVRHTRPEGAKAYAILNDRERPVSSQVASAMAGYGVAAVPWSLRREYAAELAA